jgi:hypothetical protein
MNYFAHGRQFVDRPYFLAGTAVPDLLNVVNRRVRVRRKVAEPFVNDTNPHVAALAGGIVRHHDDDEWFHRTKAFSELSLRFTVRIRDWQSADDGMRPLFLGHILVELLLDACLIEQDPQCLDAYYGAFARVEPRRVADAITRMTGRSVELMAVFIPRFLHERFLYEYLDDAKLLYRLNQVMRRVGLPLLPDDFVSLLPTARAEIAASAGDLLDRSGVTANEKTN